MEHQQQFVRPGSTPPQLSRADLASLSPAQIVQAQEAGQLDAVLSGRDPLAFEKAGERRATPEEAAQAIADQAEAKRVADAQHRSNIARAMKITEGL